jgi:hypothetical protein
MNNSPPRSIQAVAVHYGPNVHPKACVQIGTMVLSLKEAEAYAMRILEACGDGRAWDVADPIDVTCPKCGATWATKGAVGSAVRCKTPGCITRVRIPIAKKVKGK